MWCMRNCDTHRFDFMFEKQIYENSFKSSKVEKKIYVMC